MAGVANLVNLDGVTTDSCSDDTIEPIKEAQSSIQSVHEHHNGVPEMSQLDTKSTNETLGFTNGATNTNATTRGKESSRKKKSVSFSADSGVEVAGATDATDSSRHKDLPLDNESILLAATLVLDAKRGRNLDYILEDKYVKSYILYHQPYLRWLLYIFITLNMCLAIFEKPAVPGFDLPYSVTMTMELVCLTYFGFRMFHAMHFQKKEVFFKDPKNIVVLGVIALTILDMVIYIIWVNSAPDTNAIRWSRCLRPLFIINFPDGKQVRRAFRNIRRTVPDILNVLFLFLMSVLIFGLLALKLFYRRNLFKADGSPYFTNYFDSIWDLYVLVTTANNPDIMMPAYDLNKGYFFFFAIYLVLCLYIFMSIVLATIYNNYKKNLKNEIRSAVYMKRKRLAKAFNLMKVKRHSLDVISHSRWKQLMEILLPTKSNSYTDLLMKILDKENKNVLDKKDFLHLADLLHVPLSEVKDRQTWMGKYFPNVYNHQNSELFKFFVRHRFFKWFFDLLIVINAAFIAIDLDDADWFFLSAFALEIICKLYVMGMKEFFTRFWNMFDFVIIGAAFIASIIEAAKNEENEELSTLDVILILRIMRLVKLFGSIQRFKIILHTIVNIGPSIFTYSGVMFTFFYFFAIIGMEAFSGYIHYYGNGYDENYIAQHGSEETLFCGNIKLKGSLFLKAHYCNNNFNNIYSSIVVMFELIIVNQWHIIAQGFVLVTSKFARVYFFVFHMSCVVLVLNIFTAFIIEAFIVEYSLQTVPRLESVVEDKIKELGLGVGMTPVVSPIAGPSGDKIYLLDEDEGEGSKEGDIEEGASTSVASGGQGSSGVQGGYDGDDSDTDSIIDLSKEKGLKFHLKKRSRKKAEVLLQQMFQGELSEEEEGPEDMDEVDNYRKTRKLTLEEVM